MRVGILRGDLASPLFLSDLEPAGYKNDPVDPVGQQRYVSRPTTAEVTTAAAAVPAAFNGSGNITFALTIDGTNNVLRLRAAASGAFTVVTIAQAGYANLTALLVALNAALTTAALPIEAVQGTSNVRVRFQTKSPALGIGAAISLDTTANGSTANTALGLPNGTTHTVPTAATIITALNPVGGTLDVSSATQTAQISPGISAASVTAIADAIAPQFAETDLAVKSFQVGVLADLRSSSFNPDPNRLPALTPSAAVAVVQDDGVTAFSSSALAPLPTIAGAAIGGGNLTITGSGLGNSEFHNTTKVKVTNPTTGAVTVVEQRKIISVTNGAVSATSIVVPTSLLPGVAAGHKVQVQFTSLASNIFTAT